jgi:uroporphyrinogen decarboxylase
MSKREGIKNAISHNDDKSIPYSISFTGKAKEKYRKECMKHFLKKEHKKAWKKGYINFWEAVDLSMGNYLFKIHPPWWRWTNVPESYRGSFDAPEALPDTIGTGSYEAFIDKIKYVRDHTDCYILAFIFGSHFEKANACRGIEYFLCDLAANPDFSKNILDTIIRKNMVMLENITSIEEIDGILLGSDWGSQQNMLMSPQVWRELIAPGEKKEYDLIKGAGKDVWVHSCGNIEAIMPDLIELGLDVLNPLQPECMDIYDIKNKYGKDLTFYGGVSTQQSLPFGTPEEVKREVEKVATALAEGGGYITSPSQEIQEDVPFDNILAFHEKAVELAAG